MNQLKLLLWSLGLAGFVLVGCDTFPRHGSAETRSAGEIFTQLAGSAWKLDRWTDADGGGRDPGAITLTVAENNRVSGSAGVNRYTGPVKFTADGGLDLGGGFIVTKMMGLPEAMARETRYLAELPKVRQASLRDGRLILTGDGPLRLEFVPAAKP
jgi:heat shock protein HslJ